MKIAKIILTEQEETSTCPPQLKILAYYLFNFMPGNTFFCFENDVIGIVGTAADLLNLKQKKKSFCSNVGMNNFCTN